MTEYIYIVKCDDCEDEMFNFFKDARMQCDRRMSKHPYITQIEVERNDFGECTDSHDLGTVWSWEEVMNETDAEPAKSIFTKDDLRQYADDVDPEFDNIDNSVDFEIDEASDEEPLKEAYKLKGKTTKEELYDLLVYQDQTVTIDLGDQRLTEQFGEDDTYDNSELTIVFNTKGRIYPVDTFSAYETLYSNDGNTIDGDFEIETTSFDKLWDELLKVAPEFFTEDARKPVPEGMTIEQLKEAMEENEDTVECVGCEELFSKEDCFHKDGIGWLCGDCEDIIVKCTWCEELYDKSECRYEVNLKWLCDRCESAIKSRGETLTFKEGNYWDFLDESVEDTRTLAELVKDSINHLTNDLGKDPWVDDFADDVIGDLERNYENYVPTDFDKYQEWCSAVASEVSRQVNNQLDEAAEEPKIVDDLGSTYDGGYPTEEPELPVTDETPEVSDPYLKLCPECGKEAFDIETGICVECGFN